MAVLGSSLLLRLIPGQEVDSGVALFEGVYGPLALGQQHGALVAVVGYAVGAAGHKLA